MGVHVVQMLDPGERVGALLTLFSIVLSQYMDTQFH